MNIKDCQVYSGSDLKNYGYTEDGTPFIGYVYFIEVENKRGDRWRMNMHWDGVKVVPGEEGPIYMDNRPQVEPIIDRIIASIKRVGKIDMSQWYEGRCAYGSEAYLDYGMAEDLALEKMEG